jgi:DegV family protein with EDD domain
MQKIKIITDSGSDIPNDIARQMDIGVLGFMINIDGKEFREKVDCTTEEFYEMFEKAVDLPKTGQIMPDVFEEHFKLAYDNGFTDIIYVSLASIGSGTYFNAVKAKESFFENNPDAKIDIHVIDSKAYSGCYGYSVVQAAHKARKGEPVSEIVEYIKEWANSVEVYFTPYTLKYVRKSGRISAAAAFAGELLGLRPVICFLDAVSSVPKKIRGDKNVVPSLIKIAEENMIPKSPYCLILGSNKAHNEEMINEITKAFGYPPEIIFPVGATICSHAGPDLAAVVIRGKMRNEK